MSVDALNGLAINAALLAALSLLIEVLPLRPGSTSRRYKVLAGILAGLIGLAVMTNPWRFSEGIIFDTRSILLGVSGLFFGVIPTGIAALMTAGYRLLLGGGGAYTGVAVIFASAGIGILWRRLRAYPGWQVTWRELLAFGLAVHVAMLLLMLTLPNGQGVVVLRQITLPVLAVYPLITLLLGKLVASRMRRFFIERELEKSEQRYRRIVETAAEGIWLIDDKNKTVFVNDKMREILGYETDEMIGLDLFAFMHESERPLAEQYLADRRRGLTDQHDFKLVNKNGWDVWVSIATNPIFDDEGRYEGALGMMTDITEQRSVTEAVAQSRENFLTFFNTIDDFLLVTDENNCFIFVNQAVVDQLGYPAEDLLGQPLEVLVAPEYREQSRANARRIAAGEIDTCELPLRTADGRNIPAITRFTPGRWDGRPAHFRVSKDLTRLRLSERNFTKAFEASGSLIVIARESDTVLIDANRSFLETLGYAREEIVGHPAASALNLVIDSQEWETLQRAFDDDGRATNFPVKLHGRDGSLVHGLLSAVDINVDEERCWLAIIQDVTDLHVARVALHESEERYRTLVEASPFAIGVHQDGQLVFANTFAARLFGADGPEDLLGRPISPLFHPDNREAGLNRIRRQMAGETDLYPVEDRALRLDGSAVDVELTAVPISFNGRPAVQVIARDITERKEAERALRDSELKYRHLVEASHDLVWSIDQEGRISFINPASRRVFGYEPEEMIGRHFTDFIPMEDRAQVLEDRSNLQSQNGRLVNIQRWVEHRDGTPIYINANAIYLRDEAGQVVGSVGTAQDMTDRKEAEDQLRYQAFLLANVSDAIISVDLENRVTSWNQAAVDLYGWTEEEVRGMRLGELLRTTFLEAVPDNLREQIWIEGHWNGEVTQLSKSGSKLHIQSRVKPLRDDQGRPLGLVGVNRDITQQRQSERLIRETEERFSRIFFGAPIAISYGSGVGGQLINVNQRYADFFGYEREEMLGAIVDELGLWADLDERSHIAALIRDKGTVNDIDARFRTRSGEIRRVLLSMYRLRFSEDQDEVLIVMFVDVTDRQKAEQALRESEEQFSLFMRYLPGYAYIKDPQRGHLFANERFTRFGFASHKELLGRHDDALWPADIVAKIQANDNQVLADMKPRIFEEAVPVQDEDFVFLTTKFPITRADGSVVLGGISLDITDLKEAQESLRRLNAELEERVTERTAQLEASKRELETFTYSVSHDLKAPLRGVDGYSRLLQEDFGPDLPEEAHQYIENIRRGTAQMGQLIDDLLAYSREERRLLRRTEIDVGDILSALLAERRTEIEARGVVVTIEGPLPPVVADDEGVTLALRNLLDNALKFTRDSQPPRITIGSCETEASTIFYMRDNGIGFKMAYHDRIMEIFQRLHRVEDYPGTGIGLAIVSKAMARMNGRLWAESEPGAGATFFLEFSG